METELSAEDRTAERRATAFLEKLGVAFALHRHEPVFTVDQSSAIADALPGAHTKNLFLKSKRGDLVLASCFGDRRIRISDLEKAIGLRRLSFGAPELLFSTLGVRPGSVTPFALMNDPERRVRLLLDQRMLATEPLNFHPLHNAATIAISTAGFRAFLDATGHASEIVDFDALEAQAEAAREKTG